MNSTPNTLITTYLEMRDVAQFRPATLDAAGTAGCRVLQLDVVDVDYYRFLYRAVGEAWRWRFRLSISTEALRRELALPGVTVDVLYVAGAPAGYIELKREGAEVEVAYFGLREAYFGRGLGKHLLSLGVQRAWHEGAQRVWLNTCNLDAPQALSNYRRRGFEVFRVTEEPMPELLQ